MEKVSMITGQLDYLIIGLVLNHANNALIILFLFFWFVFASHNIFQNIFAGRHPVWIRSPRPPIRPEYHWTKANDDACVSAALYERDVAKDYECEHGPQQGARRVRVISALTIVFEIQNISVDEPTRVEHVQESIEYLVTEVIAPTP